MRVPLCGVSALVFWLAYIAGGFIVHRRMRQNRAIPGRLAGWAPFRKVSYTPEGQRWLAIYMRWWVWASPLALIATALLAGLVCRLVGQ